MAIWERASFDSGDGPNARINIDSGGDLWVRILSPSFRFNDGTEHCFVGHGVQVITSEPQAGGDSTAPTLSSPVDDADGTDAGTGSVDTNEGNGTLYWVVSQSATSPSAAQVKAGQDHTGAAADDSGSQAVSGTGTQNVAFSGLVAETTYYAHYMHEDAAENQSDVASGDGFTTEAAGGTVAVESSQAMSDSGDQTTWTATVSADGPYTFFVVTWENAVNISSATVGGNAADLVVGENGASAGCHLIKYTGTPPSAATLSITWASALSNTPFVTTLSVDGIASTTEVDTDRESSFNTSVDLDTFTGPGDGGIEIIGGCQRNNAGDAALSNCTSLVATDSGTGHKHFVGWVSGDHVGNPTLSGSNDQMHILGASYT